MVALDSDVKATRRVDPRPDETTVNAVSTCRGIAAAVSLVPTEGRDELHFVRSTGLFAGVRSDVGHQVTPATLAQHFPSVGYSHPAQGIAPPPKMWAIK